jgi:hypothetical protein
MTEIGFLILQLPLAGSQYHALPEIGERLRVGDRLSLCREPEHPHDPRAIRVDWQGRAIGYLPRALNRPLAAAMDAGTRLFARVIALRLAASPWQRVELAVYAAL